MVTCVVFWFCCDYSRWRWPGNTCEIFLFLWNNAFNRSVDKDCFIPFPLNPMEISHWGFVDNLMHGGERMLPQRSNERITEISVPIFWTRRHTKNRFPLEQGLASIKHKLLSKSNRNKNCDLSWLDNRTKENCFAFHFMRNVVKLIIPIEGIHFDPASF